MPEVPDWPIVSLSIGSWQECWHRDLYYHRQGKLCFHCQQQNQRKSTCRLRKTRRLIIYDVSEIIFKNIEKNKQKQNITNEKKQKKNSKKLKQKNNGNLHAVGSLHHLLSMANGNPRMYATYIWRWKRHANQRYIHPISPSVTNVIKFLATLFKAGLFLMCCVGEPVWPSGKALGW